MAPNCLCLVYWPYSSLSPDLTLSCFFLLFFLALLVPGFSGHRLVQDCQCLPSSFFVCSGCPLPLLFSHLSSADLCFRRILLYVDLGCLFPILVFHPPSPTPLLALRFPRVLCLVLLAKDWSRISSTALTFPLFLACCTALIPPPFPLGTPLPHKCPSSGRRRVRGITPLVPQNPFSPGTVSGRRLVQGLLPSNTVHGTSY